MTLPSLAVEWAEVARRDLYAIIEYLSAKSPAAALATLERVEERAAALETLPRRGRWVPELAKLLHVRGYRELQIPPYRLLYRIELGRVLVLGVFDGRRNLEDVLLQRVFWSLTEGVE